VTYADFKVTIVTGFHLGREMASARPFIVGIGGTTRPGSSSEKALRCALSLAAAEGADVELFDGASINLSMYAPESAERSEGAERMVDALRRANGVILSTPCYHGSVSGLVKNALDYTEDMCQDPEPYLDGRAVGLIVCGHGWQSTGVVLTAFRSIVHALRGWPTPMGVAINTLVERFDDDGVGLQEHTSRQMAVMVGQVMEFARLRSLLAKPSAPKAGLQQGGTMPEKRTIERARKDAREGKSASTQAGEFVREEMEHVEEGKHGVSSRKQAIAIGLSKARRAGVKLGPPPKKSKARGKRSGS
jgi:FMN reductase